MTGSEMNKLTIATMQVEALREQLANAQATVEALQRERDEARDFLNTVTNDLNEQAGELSQLQALVRALPVAIAVHVDCSIERYVRYCTSEKLNYECAFPSKEYAQAFAKLLEYRASLDATTHTQHDIAQAEANGFI